MAESNTIALGFKLTGEDDLKRGLNDINNQLKINSSQLSLTAAKYAENGKSVEALTAKNKALHDSLDTQQRRIETLNTAIEKSASAHAAAGQQIEKLKAELSNARTAMDDMKKSSDTTREDLLKQQSTIKDLNQQLRDAEKAYKNTGNNTAKWTTQLNDAQEKVITLNKQLEENSKKLKQADADTKSFGGKMQDLSNKVADADEQLNGKLTKSVETFGVVAAAAGALAVKSFLDFSEQTAKIRTLLDESVLSFGDAKKSILDMSDATAQSADAMAEAMYDALSSGVDTADVQEFMAQSSKTAVAGFTDVGTAVDILTTILNSYGMKTSQVSSISDKLLLTQDKGKVTVGELANGLGNLVGVSANAGVSLDEVLTSVAALTAGGLPASTSINSVKAAISNIIKPTAEAEEMADKLHIKFDATALKGKGLSGVLEDVRNKTGGSAEKMAVLFGSVEALNAVMSLAGANNKLFNDTLSGMNSTAGKTDEVFSKVTNESGFKFNQSLTSMKNSLIEVGDTMSPIVDLISGLIKMLGGIPAPVLIAAGSIILAINATLKIIQAINALTQLSGPVGAFFGGINTHSVKTIAIILGVVAALIALAAIIAVIIGKSSDLNNTLKNVGSSVSQIKGTVYDTQKSTSRVPSYAKIGSNARGTSFWRGGPTWVGEEGPEIVDLPQGSRVYPNGTYPGGDIYNITIDAKNVREFNDIVRIVKSQRRRTVQGAD